MNNETRRATECAIAGEAELKLAVLRGQIPVVPQTHGWDSAILLALSGIRDEPLEGAAFRTLVRRGHIRIRMRPGFESLKDAAFRAFSENSGYVEFGAWPELNVQGGTLDRRAVVEAMKARRYSTLPDAMGWKLDALDALSDDALNAPPVDFELARRDKLRTLIARAADVAKK